MDLRSDSRYFVSGSNSFITDLYGMLTERGIPRERIRTEGFDH
jgi:ferredoxin-NADP reductase